MGDYPNKPTVRPGSPETAFAAADSVADAARSREAKARALIYAIGPKGLTADEVADALGWERHSAHPRLSQLRSRGAIADSGVRRAGASGRKQAVWVAPEYVHLTTPRAGHFGGAN
jgi:predicted ArsR family transcriptional regulator